MKKSYIAVLEKIYGGRTEYCLLLNLIQDFALGRDFTDFTIPEQVIISNLKRRLHG